MGNQFKTVMEGKSDRDLLKVVTADKADYRPEATDAAKGEIKRRGLNKERIAEIKENDSISNSDKGVFISIKCTNCKYEGEPVKWGARTGLGIFYALSALIPGIIFFMNTNPYICPKCEKREHLLKIFENKAEEKIESKSKEDFLKIAVPITIILVLYLIYILSRY